ncbi:MAG TPA: hypothetical protein VF021_08300, partial [Longimicrobiales bacterium]
AVNPFTTFMRASDVQMLGAYLLGIVGVGSIGFFLAMVFRKDGGALGVLLIWASIGESLIMLLLNKWHDGWERYGRYLPFRLFLGIFEPRNFNVEAQQRMIEVAKRAHRPLPELPNMPLLVSLAALYIAVFVTGSYLNYRKRDL